MSLAYLVCLPPSLIYMCVFRSLRLGFVITAHVALANLLWGVVNALGMVGCPLAFAVKSAWARGVVRSKRGLRVTAGQCVAQVLGVAVSYFAPYRGPSCERRGVC